MNLVLPAHVDLIPKKHNMLHLNSPTRTDVSTAMFGLQPGTVATGILPTQRKIDFVEPQSSHCSLPSIVRPTVGLSRTLSVDHGGLSFMPASIGPLVYYQAGAAGNPAAAIGHMPCMLDVVAGSPLSNMAILSTQAQAICSGTSSVVPFG